LRSIQCCHHHMIASAVVVCGLHVVEDFVISSLFSYF
jgi:hypothetical protein